MISVCKQGDSTNMSWAVSGMGPPWDQDRPEKLGPDSTGKTVAYLHKFKLGMVFFSCSICSHIYIYMCVCFNNYSVIFSRHALSK